jgi:hypothetical protein
MPAIDTAQLWYDMTDLGLVVLVLFAWSLMVVGLVTLIRVVVVKILEIVSHHL